MKTAATNLILPVSCPSSALAAAARHLEDLPPARAAVLPCPYSYRRSFFRAHTAGLSNLYPYRRQAREAVSMSASLLELAAFLKPELAHGL